MDITGTEDVIVPINDTTYGKGPVSSEGWIYSLMTDIFASWEPANGCTSEDKTEHYPTSFDGVQDLYCWGKRCGPDKSAPVVRCAWKGGHNYYGNSPTLNGPLVWEFLSTFSRETHLGFGMVEGRPERFFNVSKLQVYEELNFPSNKTMVEVEDEKWYLKSGSRGLNQTEEPLALVLQRGKSSGANVSDPKHYHLYGNPKFGCLPGESALHFSIDSNTTAGVCAPRMHRTECLVGGYRTEENGCPAPHAPFHHAYPTCLAAVDQPSYLDGMRHCFLTCDRKMSKTARDPEGDARCPIGATCVPGFLRFGHVGVCLYLQSPPVNATFMKN